MKALILAAGYATRLYPLTKNFPKPLLTVGGKTIIDHIIEKIAKVKQIDEIFVVTNHCFYKHFLDWAADCKYEGNIKIIDDLTTDNENRLGAIGDINFAIESEKISDDMLVMAGDNLFDFELTELASYFERVKSDVITVHELNEINALKRTGVVQLDEQSRVISFEEKPKVPKSNLAVPPFYIFKKSTLTSLISEYLGSGCCNDAPGNFIPWLVAKQTVYAYRFKGSRYDIGTIDSYNAVKAMYEQYCIGVK